MEKIKVYRLRHKSDWSELHPELLISIAGRLQTHDDFRHFRSVCANWRSSTHHIANDLPILSPIFPRNYPSYSPPTIDTIQYPRKAKSHLIVANTTFLIQNPSPNFPTPWLVTVEELNPGKLILRKPLIRDAIEQEFPRVLDLSRFRVRKIRRDYNFQNVGKGVIPINYKLLLFFDHGSGDPTSLDHCYALVLDTHSRLLFARLKGRVGYSYLRHTLVSCFDDIVCYKGDVWAVDRKGRAYVIRYHRKHLRVERFSRLAMRSGYVGDMRKRLIESDDGLYLICSDSQSYVELEFTDPYAEFKFSVYKLNEVEHKWCEIKDLDGRMLFVSSDCCFFAPVDDFPGCVGNCIIFPQFHFLPMYGLAKTFSPNCYSSQRRDKVLKIRVFNLEDGKCGLISTYPVFSEIFWPPPRWLLSDTCPSTRGDEENEGEIPTLEAPCSSNGLQIDEQRMKTKLPTMDVHPKHRDSHASTAQNLNAGAPEKTVKRHGIEPDLRDVEENECEISTLDAPCSSKCVQIPEQALNAKLPALDVHPIHRDSHDSTVQNFNRDAPEKTFERYNIDSNLKPTLDKIWEKHGNISEGCTLRNSDMISRALESLATTVLVLKSNTGRSLSESQVDYLSSSLSDLQYMRFKVDWLIPFVEMALAIKKSRPLVDSLKEYSEAKARAHESKMKVLDEIAKLDEVEEDLTLVMEKISDLEEVDLEKCLGEGLY